MRFLLILIASVSNFQALFTELKKLFPLSSYRATNFQKTAKSYTFWGFSNFQLAIWNHTLFLAPDQFLGPIFGQVVAFEEFSKRYLGIFEILRFLAIFGVPKSKNRDFLQFYPFFASWWGWKWLKISKSQKFPNNVCITHKMQQLGQIWGLETDLGPKIRNCEISSIENLKILEMYRILAFFKNSSRDISTTEQAFWIP